MGATPKLYISPRKGDEVLVRLDERMIEALRDEHEDYPTATNHALADRVAELLAAGRRTVSARVLRGAGRARVIGGRELRVCEEFELILVRCPELTGDERTTALFCAADCELSAVELSAQRAL